jgi:HEAT repeat protein
MKRLLAFSALGLLALLVCSAQGADVDDLVKKLKDKDPDVRRAAAVELGKAGQGAAAAAPALVAALKDADAFVRRYAAEALGVIGADPKIAVPALARLLRDANEKKDTQLAAVGSLAKLGAAGVAPLASGFRDPNLDSAVRTKIIDTLGDLGAEGRPAIPALVEEFTGKNVPKGRTPLTREDRLEVLTVLGKITTPDDKSVLPPLTDEFAGKNLPKGRAPISRAERIALLPILAKVATVEDKATVAALEAVANDDKIKDEDPFKKRVKETLKMIRDKK